MGTLMPWTGITSLRKEMDRLFDRFLEPFTDELPLLGGWAPRLDVSETEAGVVVKAEVPGLEPKDIEIALHADTLTIKGEKKQEKEEKGERYHRVERSWGAFTRTVRLPAPIDAAKVEAKFKNGLLTVTLPKTPGAKSTAIPIKAE